MECWPFQKQHQTSTVQVCFAVGFLLKIEIVFKNVCGGERTYRDACLMWLIICLFYLDQYDETFNLSSSDNDVKVHSAIARSDLLGVAATDLPYVFSIEIRPQTTCWPGCTLHLLSSSFPEKQRWVRALENIVRERNNDVGKSHQVFEVYV